MSETVTAESLAHALRNRQTVIGAEGGQFVAKFMEVQFVSTELNITPYQVNELNELAELVRGEPIEGRRDTAYVYEGDEQPTRYIKSEEGDLAFKGLFRGVALLSGESYTGIEDGRDVVSLVIDPLNGSNRESIRSSTILKRHGWGTFLPGQTAMSDRRLWIPSGTISHLRFNAQYLEEVIEQSGHAFAALERIKADFPTEYDSAHVFTDERTPNDLL